MARNGTRSAQGGGTIRQRADGRWEVRFTYTDDLGQKKRASVYADTQKECRRKLTAALKSVDEGSFVKTQRYTVSQWLDEWLSTYCKDLKPATFSGYRSKIETRIKPYIGNSTLSALTNVQIQKFYNKLQTGDKEHNPLSPKSIQSIHGILHKALDQAVSARIIHSNPADHIKLPKDYIEDLVVAQCRKLLTASNIDKIANEVVAVCEAEKDTSNLKYLKKLLSENERKHKNTVDAIMDCDIESVRKTLYGKLPTLESEHAEIERQIAQEEAVLSTVTVHKIKFFLTALKKGNANDIKYRKTLINIFFNKIFLYDDRVTITFNSGDEPVTINDILLSEIEENDSKAKDLFFTGDGPPKQHNPNLFPIGDGFGFVVYLDSISA